MIIFEFPRSFVWLLVVSRMMIGFGFLGIAVELLLIIHSLNGTLLFRRTILIFAIAIGACGIARFVDGYFMLSMTAGPIVSHEVAIWVFDSISAIISVSAMVILAPLTWNAMGGHYPLKNL